LSARSNRAFLARAVRFLAGGAGIRQFLDIGTGIPSVNNTHEVAQSMAPESRVVYVDNDPIVLVHARALLASDPAGAIDYIDADLRDPQKILDGAAQRLDFGRPVGVMLMAVLQHIGEEDDPYRIVATLVGSMPAGSYLALSHPASDINAEAMAKMADSLSQMMAEKVTFRHAAQWPGSSTGWTWWSQEWFRRRNGGPPPRPRRPARPPCGPASRARTDIRYAGPAEIKPALEPGGPEGARYSGMSSLPPARESRPGGTGRRSTTAQPWMFPTRNALISWSGSATLSSRPTIAAPSRP
jgi:hypothetical protein